MKKFTVRPRRWWSPKDRRHARVLENITNSPAYYEALKEAVKNVLVYGDSRGKEHMGEGK